MLFKEIKDDFLLTSVLTRLFSGSADAP